MTRKHVTPSNAPQANNQLPELSVAELSAVRGGACGRCGAGRSRN